MRIDLLRFSKAPHPQPFSPGVPGEKGARKLLRGRVLDIAGNLRAAKKPVRFLVRLSLAVVCAYISFELCMCERQE